MKDFKVGDKVNIINYDGKTVKKTKVIEITYAGNVRVEGWQCLFRPDGSERRKEIFLTDRTFIVKA